MAQGRKTGGRQAGTPNKATAEMRMTITQAARLHCETALQALAEIAVGGESEAARVSAANALLDRGDGRPPQALAVGKVDGDDPGNPLAALMERIGANGRRVTDPVPEGLN